LNQQTKALSASKGNDAQLVGRGMSPRRAHVHSVERALDVEACTSPRTIGLGDDDSKCPVMREIEELGDIPPRVVGDGATGEQGIEEGDAAMLLRAYQLGRCVPIGVGDGFEKPVDQVPEGCGYVRQSLPFMLAGHRDDTQQEVPESGKADSE